MGLPVVVPGMWKFLMTRTAGAFASDTVLGPDLALDTPGLWQIEWYAIVRAMPAAGNNTVTFMVREGATIRYQYAQTIADGGSGPMPQHAHRILYAADSSSHVVQVETNSGIVVGDSIEVCKSAQLLYYITQTREIRSVRVLSLEGLDIIKVTK